MLAGMAVGAVTMFSIWSTGALAWTWYALVGATTTGVVALALATLPGFRVPMAERKFDAAEATEGTEGTGFTL